MGKIIFLLFLTFLLWNSACTNKAYQHDGQATLSTQSKAQQKQALKDLKAQKKAEKQKRAHLKQFEQAPTGEFDKRKKNKKGVAPKTYY